MNDFLIYLPLEAFLAQWFQTPPRRIGIRRAPRARLCGIQAAESTSRRAAVGLRTRPAPPGTVPVAIPSFPAKDPRQFNYVSPQGINALVETLRDLFDLELHDYYVKTYIKGSRIDYMLEAWMELHGIEFNDTNYNSVKKRLDRVRKKIYVKRHRDKGQIRRNGRINKFSLKIIENRTVFSAVLYRPSFR